MRKNENIAKADKMSLDKSNGGKETDYLLSTLANTKRLKRSIKDAEKGKTRKFKINEI